MNCLFRFLVFYYITRNKQLQMKSIRRFSLLPVFCSLICCLLSKSKKNIGLVLWFLERGLQMHTIYHMCVGVRSVKFYLFNACSSLHCMYICMCVLAK